MILEGVFNMMERHGSLWTIKEDKKLKTTFLKYGKLFSVNQFARDSGRTSTAISTRLVYYLFPYVMKERLYDKDFAVKVKEIFPNQGIGSDFERMLCSRGCYC
tara:strand:+ start:252 stop:560 length:309 start_codon:yes stop_codon:yes gene_type:complete